MGKRGPLADNAVLRGLKQRLLDDEANAREEQIRQLKKDDEAAANAQGEADRDQASQEREVLERDMATNRPNKYIGGRGGARPRPQYLPHRDDLNK
jgi:hypothetical protein